jgi:hypothetical protein
MAGIGSCPAPILVSGAPVHMRHCLESVKILPPVGANPPELYGAITAQAVARPEINAPERARVFSLAVTATDERDRGQPTSWSSAVDALAVGRVFDPTTSGLVYLDEPEIAAGRLFILSAGNVETLQAEHLDRSDVEPVHDPAQAWNALTVGASTEKAAISDDDCTRSATLRGGSRERAELLGHRAAQGIGRLSWRPHHVKCIFVAFGLSVRSRTFVAPRFFVAAPFQKDCIQLSYGGRQPWSPPIFAYFMTTYCQRHRRQAFSRIGRLTKMKTS